MEIYRLSSNITSEIWFRHDNNTSEICPSCGNTTSEIWLNGGNNTAEVFFSGHNTTPDFPLSRRNNASEFRLSSESSSMASIEKRVGRFDADCINFTDYYSGSLTLPKPRRLSSSGVRSVLTSLFFINRKTTGKKSRGLCKLPQLGLGS